MVPSRLVSLLQAPLLLLALAAGCGAPRPYGEGVALHTLFEAGGRVLDRDDLDGGAAYALELVTLERSSGWGYEGGWTVAAEDAGGARDLEAEFDELHLGLRRTFSADQTMRPYFGFGGAFTRLVRELESPELTVTEDGGAAYLHAGILWAVGRFQLERGNDLLLGFDLKGLVGNDYDTLQLALVLGAGG
ncbi:MAG TPA: hypothetical protein VF530_11820 [Planctomycetota bacterium]